MLCLWKVCGHRKRIQRPVQDTHRGRVPSNKSRTLSKNMNMDIWVVAT